MSRRRAHSAAGGIVGPVAFAAAWSILGARTHGYSAVEDPISRLAAVGAPTRMAMTGGMLALAAGVASYAVAARGPLGRPVAVSAGVTALATAGVALLPLDRSSGGDVAHAVVVAAAYASLAATPLLGAWAPAVLRRRAGRGLSLAAGLASGAALSASALAPSAHGLLQRTGLSLGHAWIAGTAACILAGSRGARAGRHSPR